MLARVGSVGPLEATISNPATAPIISRCEAQPQRLGPAPAALAGRDRPTSDDAGGTTADTAHPPRPAPRREGRGCARFSARAPARDRRRAGLAAHRQARYTRRPD